MIELVSILPEITRLLLEPMAVNVIGVGLVGTTTAALIAAGVGAAGSVGSAAMSASAAGKAAKTQSRAAMTAAELEAESAEEARELQREMYGEGREDLAPWREAGGWALDELQNRVAAGPGTFEESPGYQFRMSEGLKAIDRRASASGGLGSGGHKKALMGYGQNLASAEFDSWLDRYYKSLSPHQSMSGMGLGAVGQTAALGASTGARMGQATMAAGAARGTGYTDAAHAKAAGYINRANAWRGAFQDVATIGALASRGSSNPEQYDTLAKKNKRAFSMGGTII